MITKTIKRYYDEVRVHKACLTVGWIFNANYVMTSLGCIPGSFESSSLSAL